jgi:hypothetical protein
MLSLKDPDRRFKSRTATVQTIFVLPPSNNPKSEGANSIAYRDPMQSLKAHDLDILYCSSLKRIVRYRKWR